jgi:pimeloyl-ACP methyl ester carboxylesterase
VIIFDRWGSGASGPTPEGSIPNWEVFTEDVGAVLEAAKSKRTAVIGTRETGQIAMLYAAMHLNKSPLWSS